MSWQVTQASFDYGRNKAVVSFADSGGSEAFPRDVHLHFSLGAPGQSVSDNVSEGALIAQAKQIMTDLANSP